MRNGYFLSKKGYCEIFVTFAYYFGEKLVWTVDS